MTLGDVSCEPVVFEVGIASSIPSGFNSAEAVEIFVPVLESPVVESCASILFVCVVLSIVSVGGGVEVMVGVGVGSVCCSIAGVGVSVGISSRA